MEEASRKTCNNSLICLPPQQSFIESILCILSTPIQVSQLISDQNGAVGDCFQICYRWTYFFGLLFVWLIFFEFNTNVNKQHFLLMIYGTVLVFENRNAINHY